MLENGKIYKIKSRYFKDCPQMSNYDRDLKAKLEELEAQINQQKAQQKIETIDGEIETETKQEAELISQVYYWLNLARNKFNSLSVGGKLIVGITTIWFGFTVLNLALHLVTNLIVVSILGIFLYFAYQKLIVKGNRDSK
jgi:hypothetical protein